MPSWKKLITSGSDATLNSLNVTNSLTASGIIYPTTDGTSGQVVITDGTGNLSFSNIENTTISIKNVSGTTIQKGTPCYITGSGTAGNVAGVWPADASNPLRMPAGVIAGESLTAGAEGVGLLNGFINGVNTSAFAAGDSVYVAVGGGYTNVRPTGSSVLIQKLGNVEKSHASNGSGVINGPGYYNEVPNIQQGYTWVGNGNGVAVAVATSSIQNVVSSSFASTASFVNTLNQSVLITGSVTVGATSAGASENTLTLGARDGSNEGGQIGFNAPGGTYTSASFIDNWQNKARILKGNNTTSTGLIAQWDIHTTQMQLAGYTGASSFPGTATANLAVDSGGNVITVSTSGGGGSAFPYTGNAVITGSLTTTQAIYAQPNGGMYFQGGDDAALYDINVANTMGIYGVQNSTVGAIKLGSSGPVLFGSASKFGIGTITPTQGTLEVNGNVYATSFTGSLFGTASYASNADTLDGQHGAYYYAASNPSGYTTNTGTVTSVATSGTVSGITLTGGTITTTGTITLGGSISGLTNSNLSGTAGITNANLANSSITIAGNSISLGGSITQAQILAGSGVWSGSAQLPSGIVSGSSQVSYTGLSNIPAGIVSGSTQVKALLPAGSVSASAQVTGLTNANLSGTAGITNANLANSAITIAGISTSLGGSISQATILAGSGVFSGSAQISGLTNANLSGTAGITNANLANSSITIGSTAVSLGSSATTISGLTSVTSTTFVGALTGNASTATSASYASTSSWAANVVNSGVTSVATSGTVNGITLTGGTITSTGTITLGGTLSGIGNSQLTNSSITVGSTSISLGSSATTIAGLSSVTSTTFVGALTGNASTATTAAAWTTGRTITIGSTGKTVNGSGNVSWTLAEIGAYANTNPSGYTTNTGTVTSVATTGTVSGITLTGGTITSTGTITLGGSISGLTNSNLSGTAGITNANLANSSVTIGSTAISLGSSATTITGLSSVTSTTFVGALTGNASTATSATSAGSVSGLTLTNSGTPADPDTVTQNQIGYNNNVSLFSQTDGGLYSSAYSSAWIHQIFGDFRTGQIAIRGKNSGTWQSWRTVLDSTNFSTYAATAAQGTNADTAYGWGNHASAGYYAASNPSGYTTNTGTVTSVATTGTVSGITLTGGTITTTGTITLGGTLAVTPSNFSSQTANTFLAAPNGSAGTPTFRSIVAADIPTLNQNTTGTATNATNIAITNDTTTNATYYPVFSAATSGNTAARVDNSTLTLVSR
jgi:hypothetical protein